MESICREDLLIIKKQIGRYPNGVNHIVRRCSYGYPVLIESNPVVDGKPFPTLYWLTCPFLIKAVSRLEAHGWILRLENMIEQNPEFKERYLRAHQEVMKRRERLINDEITRERLSKVGSGGIKDLRRVKCLHLHLADYLGGVDNPVGEMVFKTIGVIECDKVICR